MRAQPLRQRQPCNGNPVALLLPLLLVPATAMLAPAAFVATLPPLHAHAVAELICLLRLLCLRAIPAKHAALAVCVQAHMWRRSYSRPDSVACCACWACCPRPLRVCRYIEEIVQQQVDAGIPSTSVAVGGFSQGGAMALLSLRSKVGAMPCAALCCAVPRCAVRCAALRCVLCCATLGSAAHNCLAPSQLAAAPCIVALEALRRPRCPPTSGALMPCPRAWYLPSLSSPFFFAAPAGGSDWPVLLPAAARGGACGLRQGLAATLHCAHVSCYAAGCAPALALPAILPAKYCHPLHAARCQYALSLAYTSWVGCCFCVCCRAEQGDAGADVPWGCGSGGGLLLWKAQVQWVGEWVGGWAGGRVGGHMGGWVGWQAWTAG